MSILWNLEFWKFPLHQHLLLSRSLPHRKKLHLFFFFYLHKLKISEESCPKEFSHNILEANKCNMAIPPFFFFLTSILTHFKTWQTGEKNKMKVSKMASDKVSSEIMLQQEKSHWQVGIEVFTRASHICKKVKSIQNIICLVCDKLEAKNERGHQNTLFI